jgi:uncharacterized SAM-binding protein YcdF (DUF218 family)
MSSSVAQIIYDYLSAPSSPFPTAVDAIIGFGHFDLRIPQRWGELWTSANAPRIIFTGGIGAGSADLKQSEANAFADALQANFPQIPGASILIENQSTNTGENVRFWCQKAAIVGWCLNRVILVATPFRQRRVNLTWRAQGPTGSQAYAAPPALFGGRRLRALYHQRRSFYWSTPGRD